MISILWACRGESHSHTGIIWRTNRCKILKESGESLNISEHGGRKMHEFQCLLGDSAKKNHVLHVELARNPWQMMIIELRELYMRHRISECCTSTTPSRTLSRDFQAEIGSTAWCMFQGSTGQASPSTDFTWQWTTTMSRCLTHISPWNCPICSHRFWDIAIWRYLKVLLPIIVNLLLLLHHCYY